MSTRNCFSTKVKKNFDRFFDKALINRISKSSGFVLRRARKITAYHFVLGFFISSCRQQNTFSGWAFQIGLLSGKSVSKQGLFDRLHCSASAFAKQLLQQVLLEQTAKEYTAKMFVSFGKVLLHDSTTLRLPEALSKMFPGNYSMGKQKAVAKIQSIIDIKAMRFIDLVLGAFTENDQSASGSIVGQVKKGDLVIRDLGYFATSTFEKLIELEVHFLSRLRYRVSLFDKQGNPISVKKLLQGGKQVDRWVFMGTKKRLKVRLVMIPLPKEQAADKIRKAKQDRDKRLNHSKMYYQWLGYSVYVTTVGKDVWSGRDVRNAYGVRWQIEIIFKSWKTGFHLQDMLHEGCGNQHRVRVSIYLMLLFICLFMKKVYVRYKDEIEKRTDKQLSLIKLTVFVVSHMTEIFSIPTTWLKQLIAQQCCYEKRYDRVNMAMLCQNL
jgi:hypothetical protein